MERKDLATPPTPQKKGTPTRNDLNQYSRYHRSKGHNTDDCKILKRDIEILIPKRLLKKFVVHRERSRSPSRGDRNVSPRKAQENEIAKKGTLNAISGGFASGGETSAATEVYASQT